MRSSLIERIVDYFSTEPYIAAVVLIGSNASCNIARNDEYSDIEFLVFTDNGRKADAEKRVLQLQKLFGTQILSIHFNAFAGWVLLFDDLLRVEIRIGEMDDSHIYPWIRNRIRGGCGGYDILYQRGGDALSESPLPYVFHLGEAEINYQIKDYFYMLVHGAQHFGRGEYWKARKVIEVHLQKIILTLLYYGYYDTSLGFPADDRLEMKFSSEHMKLIGSIAVTADPNEIAKALEQSSKILRDVIFGLTPRQICCEELYERLWSGVHDGVQKYLSVGLQKLTS